MATLTVQSGKAFPSWTFSYYIYYTEINYRKLVIINKILDLIGNGYPDECFKVARTSMDVFQDRDVFIADFERFIPFISKNSDYIDFWGAVRRLERPAVFVRSPDGDQYEPVYRPWGPEALQIRDAQIQSPFKLTFEGFAEAINALRFATPRERRAEEQHAVAQRHEMIRAERETSMLMSEKLELISKIDGANLSEDAKREIRHHVLGIAGGQANRNGSIEAEFSDDAGTLLPPGQDE